VINMSIESPGRCFLLEDAVNYAWNRDVLPIAAAGNAGTSSRRYPAAFDNVMAVAATDNDDRRASFSNYGKSWVDLAAPGSRIATTLPRYPNAIGPTGYGYLSGTSFASPLVAGAAALIWPSVKDQNHDGFRSDDVAKRLFRYAEHIPGTGSRWRFGRLNACRAFAAGARLCPPPAFAGSLPAMVAKDARRYARDALRRKFGEAFTRGSGVELSCSRVSATKFECAVRWLRGDHRYKGAVTARYARRSDTVVVRSSVAVKRTVR
jgi:hypothetical protein